IRITAILLHPMAPIGTEKLQEYLQVDDRFWSWDTVFEPINFFVGENHKLKFLPPRTDFFTRHESQFAVEEN
ncbi:MAG: methionine--tRNA ligase, partial [Oscillospiraceae bacterium]|nr:methionine--tRNA ligase [Oscillospiraceae bacterium]